MLLINDENNEVKHEIYYQLVKAKVK